MVASLSYAVEIHHSQDCSAICFCAEQRWVFSVTELTHLEGKKGSVCNCCRCWWWLLVCLGESQAAKLASRLSDILIFIFYYCLLIIAKIHIWYSCSSSLLTKGKHYIIWIVQYFVKWRHLCSVLWVRKYKFGSETVSLSSWEFVKNTQGTEGRSADSQLKASPLIPLLPP